MKSLNQHFRPAIESGVRASKWFRTAPEEFQKAAKVKILGVDQVRMLGRDYMRPALIAECECGCEVQRFAMLLDDFGSVEIV